MSTPKVPLSVWLALLACAALSLLSLSYRYKVEAANKAVGFVAEIDQIEALALAQRMSLDEGLEKLKEAGLTGVVLSERTFGELESSALINFIREGSGTVIVGGRADEARALQNRFGTAARVQPDAQGLGLRTDLPVDLIRATSVGLDPEQAELAKRLELDLVARHGNPNGGDATYVRETVAWSRELGTRYFLPAGEQVLGRRDNLKTLLEALEQNQIYYASPEFAKIGGDANVLQQAPERVVRLHAAQAAEMDKLTLGGAVERYAKAATERGIRLLLIRPLTTSAEQPLTAFADLIRAIRKQVEKEGGTLRSPHPYLDSAVPQPLFVAIGLSLAPLLVFVAGAMAPGRRWTLAAAVLGTLLGLACWVDTGRTFAALLGSMLLPLVAIVALPSLRLKNVLLQFLALSLISVVGGLVVSALLNGLPYFIRADQFTGVKLAHFAPIVVIGAWAFFTLTDGKRAMNQPILWTQAALGVVLAGAMAFMLSRTGNDNPAGVSGLELQLRSLLEQWLVVRPRTKEFIIGHPAMIVALGMMAMAQASETFRQKWGGWTALALMLGAIGQTSMVNTLCHLHTPLSIGFARIGVGWILGAIVGYALWLVVRPRLSGGKQA